MSRQQKDYQTTLYASMKNEHSDVAYYKKEEICMILSKGLANTCEQQPRNPIEYFGKWLQEYSKVQKQAKAVKDNEKVIEEKKAKHAFAQKSVFALEAEKLREEQKKADKKQKFWDDLYKSSDPYDNLEELAMYLHENIGATGVYVGQLEKPFIPIAEDAGEKAHIDEAQPEIIKFKFSNTDHRTIVCGTNLKPGQGITHDVFNEEFTTKNEAITIETKATGEKDYTDITKKFKHIFVDEVVREDKMHFWNVPRLGSFMAVPLVYKSSLSVNSLQTAYDDYATYTEAVLRQNELIQEFEEAQEASRVDAEAAGTVFTPEEREWPQIDLPAIQTANKRFVVCIDSMGQDRVFTAEERTFILETVHKYRTHWEIFENDKLVEDRDALIA